MERKWSGEVGNICTDPQWAAQRMLQEQEEKGECDQGRKQRGSSRKPGDAEMLWEVSRRTWAHLQPRQSTEGSGARGAPDARPKPEPLWIVLGPGDTTWAFVFVLYMFKSPELSASPSLRHGPPGIRVSLETK